MRPYFITFLVIVLSFGTLYSQEGSKIDLKNVNVGTERLPTIFLFGEEYTARERDELLRGLLKSQFYRQDLRIIINLQEFISKRVFSFRHKGPVDIIIDGKTLKNENRYNNSAVYQAAGDNQVLKLLNQVENVRIDSNLNGILERIALKREIISIDKEIKKLMEDIKAEVKVDTIVIPDKTSKKRERELNRLYRIKNRQEKRLNETKLIEINIITN
tara:strand:+ start:280 stop:927 length:648 start_codon:yes stop_codon:yes gene_type:complete